MVKYAVLILLWVVTLTSCTNAGKDSKHADSRDTSTSPDRDMHTLSNARRIAMKHLDLDIKVDMDHHQIAGCATWTIENKEQLDELILDTHDLTIDKVEVRGEPVKYYLDSPVKYLGRALRIRIAGGSNPVSIYYHTAKDAKALQWLTPQQTNDKTAPFLYTQSEAIYARSWIPCADGPGIRFTYNARVTVPKGLMALMSAQNPQQVSDSGIYRFKMELPVPAYLMALAVGNIAFKSIDNRTGVYAEPGMIDKVRREFEDVSKMVTVAEGLYGAYRWGRYDVLVLPPGFPIGGMENPRLTFATPTIIAGDRSLVSLVAHELAHSWSGNLVTNATWNDLWMNEGFTDYFERRIMEQMMGVSYSDMLWELGYQDMVDNVHEIGAASKDTWLKMDLKGRDPDEGLSDIPYEKGSHFLKLVEQTVGRAKFDSFLSAYFNAHAFSTITTEQFIDYLEANLLRGNAPLEDKINIKAWVYGPGIPMNCPKAGYERFKKVDEERGRWEKGTAATALKTKEWTTHEWLHFLRDMPDLDTMKMKQLDNAFHFTTSRNSEIADLWFVMALKAGYATAYPAMEKFLSSVGRQKFLTPLYGAMMKRENGKEMAVRLYTAYKDNYHPIAQETIEKIVYKK